MRGITGVRGRHAVLVGLLVAFQLAVPGGALAESPSPRPAATTPAPTATPSADPGASRPQAVCEPRASFEHQLVTCRVEGLAPGGAVVLRVRSSEPADTGTEWVGGGRTDADGTATPDVAVPCGTTGVAATEVSGPLPEGGRFRHRVSLQLPGTCSPSPVVPPDVWIAVASALVALCTIVVLAGAWRHRTRRRRGVTGPSGRSRPDPRGRGRRRPPRRRRRRRSRGRRRRRRRR